MLFDLRGRGRRRTVQVIYLTLAILMGGGLVLFGIGGSTSGGLFDALGGGGGTNDNSFQQRVDTARKKVDATPTSVVAWKDLARAEYQLSGTGDNFDSNAGTFTTNGKAQLRKADAAWQRYLELLGTDGKADGPLASQMVQVYSSTGLNQPAKAVTAQEYAIDSQPASSGLYANLAVLAYQAGQMRKGDLSSAKALELASDDQRASLKTSLDAAKSSAASATGGGAGAVTTTTG